MNTQRLDFLIGRFTDSGYLQIKQASGFKTWFESIHCVEEKGQEYGAWDFELEGFSEVRSVFEESVLPVVVVKSNGDHDIGSAFMVKGNFVVTARHCVIPYFPEMIFLVYW